MDLVTLFINKKSDSVRILKGLYSGKENCAVRYKLEVRGVRFPIVLLELFIDLILPATLWT
jgi:hypothetical protein